MRVSPRRHQGGARLDRLIGPPRISGPAGSEAAAGDAAVALDLAGLAVGVVGRDGGAGLIEQAKADGRRGVALAQASPGTTPRPPGIPTSTSAAPCCSCGAVQAICSADEAAAQESSSRAA